MQYELLDSGGGEKLEKFGEFVLRRPDPNAIWQKSLSKEEWAKCDAEFHNTKGFGVAKWTFNKNLPEEWIVEIGGFQFKLGLKSFKHIGVFPEHIENWKWISQQVTSNKLTVNCKILNLFGYTGGATLASAKNSSEVVHVDSSKQSVARAKENAELSDLKDSPIRYIVDDCSVFLKREIKRGNRYDGIILDPPSFGRGLKGEVWKIEEDLLPFLEMCKNILSPKPKFILLNGYAAGYSSLDYAQALSSIFGIPVSKIEHGELSIKESTSRQFSLSAGIFARINFTKS